MGFTARDYLDQQTYDRLNQSSGGGQVPDQIVSNFADKFKQLTGNDPGLHEIQDYVNNAGVQLGGQPGDPLYNDLSGNAESYINDKYGQQIKQRGVGDAAKNYGQVDQLFQSNYGRAATQEEKDHFGSLISSGAADAYTVGQFLQQLPENVKKQDAAFQDQLRTQMQGQDARYFNEQLMPGIQSTYAKQGRSFDSSGFQNALAQAGQQQNTARETFLSNLSAQQYQGNKTNAYNDYLNSVNRTQGNQDYTRTQADQKMLANTNRQYELQNFDLQRQAYDQYLQKYGKRSNAAGIGSLVGGALGAGIGGFASKGNPSQGAMAGYGVGSGLGGGTGSFF